MCDSPFETHLSNLFASKDRSIVCEYSLQSSIHGKVISLQRVYHSLGGNLTHRVEYNKFRETIQDR